MCLEPLDADPDTNGKKSDHRIVVIKPINVINNKCLRQTREIKVRPFPQSGITRMREWFIDYQWNEVFEVNSAHEKAKTFQNTLIKKLDEFFPEKIRKIASDDSPWMTNKLKNMDRKRKRTFHRERKSINWRKKT